MGGVPVGGVPAGGTSAGAAKVSSLAHAVPRHAGRSASPSRVLLRSSSVRRPRPRLACWHSKASRNVSCNAWRCQRGVARAPRAGVADKRSPGGRSAGGSERVEAMDGRNERPATGHGRPRSNAGVRTPGGQPMGDPSAGPAKVSSFLGGTSSLLKRSPIPASPPRWKEAKCAAPGADSDPEATLGPRHHSKRNPSLALEIREQIANLVTREGVEEPLGHERDLRRRR